MTSLVIIVIAPTFQRFVMFPFSKVHLHSPKSRCLLCPDVGSFLRGGGSSVRPCVDFAQFKYSNTKIHLACRNFGLLLNRSKLVNTLLAIAELLAFLRSQSQLEPVRLIFQKHRAFSDISTKFDIDLP